MSNLKEVKERIASVKATQQITKTMRMVSAAKLKKAQERMISLRNYHEKLDKLWSHLFSPEEGETPPNLLPYLHGNGQQELWIGISSDKGLCGAFNSHVIKSLSKQIQEEHPTQKQNSILPIGKRIQSYVHKHQLPCHKITLSSDISHLLNYPETEKLSIELIQQFLKGEINSVRIVYNSFKSTGTYLTQTIKLLPLGKDSLGDRDIYLYDSSQAELIADLIPHLLSIRLYQAILESISAEHAARMTAMDKASENAKEILRDLQISYNRTRQAIITTELSEIIAGADALQAG
ncbi:MAG: ATP synthase F1 subunit gamma [Cytophagales bacterium]|nr:ATP synthase F1 subunit gamma [Cytophagales bacterium]